MIRRVWRLLHAKSYAVAKCPPVGVAWKLGDGVPTQLFSSSSDRGPNFRERAVDANFEVSFSALAKSFSDDAPLTFCSEWSLSLGHDGIK
ncbi:hypothetical protein AVEN_59301-1 [Araneus ventricosus]|uniref:Uncharacterized protein n=1 Tax=Araneus ventricosus TaxID=182803 RepID=A0A4Y2G9F2_ARAVE|nr:hypothetical protein AVEN_59301-1 [Araneus ventricosus]